MEKSIKCVQCGEEMPSRSGYYYYHEGCWCSSCYEQERTRGVMDKTRQQIVDVEKRSVASK